MIAMLSGLCGKRVHWKEREKPLGLHQLMEFVSLSVGPSVACPPHPSFLVYLPGKSQSLCLIELNPLRVTCLVKVD
jgi:hypothetical protein